MFRRQVLVLVFPAVCAASGCGGSATAPTAPTGSLSSSTASLAVARCTNGAFENASGQLVNHGTINLNTLTLAYSARGRVCGDGL